MNHAWIADGILIAVFLITVYRSCKRGFVNCIARLVSIIGAVICAGFGTFVLDGVLERHIFGPLLENTVGAILSNALDGVESSLETAAEAVKNAASELIAQAGALGFSYDTAITEDLAAANDFDTLQQYTEKLTDDITQPIAARLSEIAAFLLIFFLVYWIIRAVFHVLSAVMRAPVLNSANRLLGFCCGIILGLAYTWLCAQVMALVIGVLYANGTIPADIAAAMNGTIFEFFTHGGIAGSGSSL